MGLLTNFVVGPEGPLLWMRDGPVTINGDSGESLHIIIPCEDNDGVWFIADFSAPAPVRVSTYTKLYPDSDWVLEDQIQVPEPTTIALLGLGGLLLRRRK